MKIISSILILFILTHYTANAQLTKGTWLLGGNGSYRSSKYNVPGGQDSKQTLIGINGNIGYFVRDKFAIGLKPGYERYDAVDFSRYISNEYKIGPFVRLYFLPNERQVNLFAELSHQFGYRSVKGGGSFNNNNFSGLAGVAAFLNTTIALEFTLGYSYYLYNNNTGDVKSIIAGVGFQFHLEN